MRTKKSSWFQLLFLFFTLSNPLKLLETPEFFTRKAPSGNFQSEHYRKRSIKKYLILTLWAFNQLEYNTIIKFSDHEKSL